MRTPITFRSVGELRADSIEDRKGFYFYIRNDMLIRLGVEARLRKTTVAEILRTLAESWIDAIDKASS